MRLARHSFVALLLACAALPARGEGHADESAPLTFRTPGAADVVHPVSLLARAYRREANDARAENVKGSAR